MFPRLVATLGSRGLEDRARHPAMPLVIDGIRPLEKWEAAVLWLECGLQVRAVVDRMRPCVAREEHESFGEALLYIDRERVVPGARIGELRVHAVERNRNSKTGWISREVGECNLSAVATGGRGERRVRTGRPEKIEKCRCTDKAHGGRWIAVRSSKTLTQCSRRNQEDTSGTCVHARIRGACRDYDGDRITDAQTRSCCVKGVLRKQFGIGGVDVYRPVQVEALRVLVPDAHFP